ncbi:cadherin-like domain-containing protein [Alteromonas sp. 5E99-2]|uniref:Ig-like domain-containing protein n=1 Tax=Alteromonas sp. 5E99-2 TaxID=2817683 RepID=UPI001A9801E1|nr:Ig-like domain-containing protein [Alteromonas sp. 5E99-2]MBO1255479.1 cadherin-like domain-containing protein [Alteromonas sp. 5E99-2]
MKGLELLLAASVICCVTGCGGSSSGNDEAPNDIVPPDSSVPSNATPIAQNDVATSTNDQSITIDVLANDTDQDGDALSISSINSEGIQGTVVIENNAIVYTPSELAYGQETFFYTATDGEETDQGSVTVTNFQQVELSGLTAGNVMPNAQITLEVNNQVLTTDADEQGQFQFSVRSSEQTAPILISAAGVGEQSHIVLKSFTPSFSDLITRAGEQRVVSESNFAGGILSYISTANYLLFNEQIDSDDGIQSFEEFNQQQSFEHLLEISGFLSLLANNDDFSLPSGVNIFSFFLSSDSGVENTLYQYLGENGYLNGDGAYNDVYSALLEDTNSEILAASNLTIDYLDSMVLGNTFATFSRRGEFLRSISEAYIFEDNGLGETSRLFDEFLAPEFRVERYSWEIVEGKLVISYGEENTNEPRFFSNCDDSFILDTFGAEVVEVCESAEASEISVTDSLVSEQWALVYDLVNGNRVARTENIRYQLDIEGAGLDSLSFEQDVEEIDSLVYANVSESPMVVETSDVAGSSWVMPIDSSVEFVVDTVPTFSSVEEGIMAELVNFDSSNNVSTKLGGKNGTWDLDGDTINIFLENIQVFVTPFSQVEASQLALIRVVNTQSVQDYTYVAEITPSDSASVEGIDVTSDAPMIWIARSTANDTDYWSNGALDPRRFFGISFESDLSLRRVFTDFDSSNEISSFFINSAIAYTWKQEGNIVQHNGVRLNTTVNGVPSLDIQRQRMWVLIAKSSSGTVKILEYDFFGAFEADGDLSQEVTFTNIRPRLATYVLDDLSSSFPSLWQRALDEEVFD